MICRSLFPQIKLGGPRFQISVRASVEDLINMEPLASAPPAPAPASFFPSNEDYLEDASIPPTAEALIDVPIDCPEVQTIGIPDLPHVDVPTPTADQVSLAPAKASRALCRSGRGLSIPIPNHSSKRTSRSSNEFKDFS